ncbi:helix-turn-helix domain-containing protein [Spongiibacter marinus]|uniref:helix-turn-helix domain-containing protein n=1 Tax=Spongiibacter marinus TaxID=354246 RepID=UPI003B8473B4|nr:transcriptional regulator with XRE-family HTH domain [Spongiibacter marinus]
MGKMRNRDDNILAENSEWLVTFFNEAGVSQVQVATALGVTESAVSKWKRTGNITAENIVLICELFEFNPPVWLRDKRLEDSEPHRTEETLLRIQSLYEDGHLTLDDLLHLERMALHIAGLRQALEKKG